MKRTLILGLLLTLGLVVGAAGAQTSVDAVAVQTSSPHGFIYAGFYTAAANGYYDDADLEVDIRGGGFNAERVWIDSIAEVLAGEADFGVTSLPQLLAARAAGQPIVGVATVMQRSPLAIMSLPESNMVTPEDLVGKTIAISGGNRLSFNALMSTLNIDTSTITLVEREQDSLQQLMDGKIDGLGAWLIIDGVALEEAGLQPNYIVLADYGIDTYDVMLFTREDVLAERPDVVERFVSATLQGYDELRSDPAQAAEVTVSYSPETLVYDQQFNRINAFLPMIKPANSLTGMLLPDVFDYNHDLLVESGVLATPLDDLSTAYDLSALTALYGELE